MRRLAFVLAVAGCSSPSDAGPDGGPITVIDSRIPDAAPEAPTEPSSGAYRIAWECAESCIGDAPFVYFDRLEIDSGGELRYWHSGCADCAHGIDTWSPGEGGCIDGVGIPYGESRSASYTLCPGEPPSANIPWENAYGPAGGVWTMALVGRLQQIRHDLSSEK